ncbi:hypothetical protein BV898_10558 [Hypsibius exemplaris]|uniref:Protein sleepless n=1 Tax=Hypsibius exemplaris TaxID=2072580 RepID=A0A1W0WJJ9_HYPEX|nr:hypothetical protein BV898_10558 [Hypsibius exemplaris]
MAPGQWSKLFFGSVLLVFAGFVSKSQAEVTFCHFCLPTFDDPLKCQNLDAAAPTVECKSPGDVCTTMLFYATDETWVSLRGCAKLLRNFPDNATTRSGNCAQWKDAPNFYFTPVEASVQTDSDAAERYKYVGTELQRAKASFLLGNLFPRSDAHRVMQEATPIQEMLTFAAYPETRVCVCREDNCNFETSSASGFFGTSKGGQSLWFAVSIVSVILLC